MDKDQQIIELQNQNKKLVENLLKVKKKMIDTGSLIHLFEKSQTGKNFLTFNNRITRKNKRNHRIKDKFSYSYKKIK